VLLKGDGEFMAPKADIGVGKSCMLSILPDLTTGNDLEENAVSNWTDSTPLRRNYYILLL
jgi:hypothetical protein